MAYGLLKIYELAAALEFSDYCLKSGIKFSLYEASYTLQEEQQAPLVEVEQRDNIVDVRPRPNVSLSNRIWYLIVYNKQHFIYLRRSDIRYHYYRSVTLDYVTTVIYDILATSDLEWLYDMIRPDVAPPVSVCQLK